MDSFEEFSGSTGGGAGAAMIIKYDALLPSARLLVDSAIDEIFFEASSVKVFSDEATRKAFRWLWLGRYLSEEPEHAFVALIDDSAAGYLVGSLAEPAVRPEFAELAYYQAFALETAHYPAHLHVNVRHDMRGSGIGADLVRHFEDHARSCYASGVHVVTGTSMRNVRFYERIGYHEVSRTLDNRAEVLMLAKSL